MTHTSVRQLRSELRINPWMDAMVDVGRIQSRRMDEPADEDRERADDEMPRYEVILRGRLDPSWSDWFCSLQLHTNGEGNTVLSGALPDQAALHGLLARIRDLGIELLELRRLDC